MGKMSRNQLWIPPNLARVSGYFSVVSLFSPLSFQVEGGRDHEWQSTR